MEPHESTLAELHERHRARLERIVTGRTRDPELAADVVSEAFIRLQLESMAGRMPTDPTAWLCRVACNLATSEGRHRQVVTRTASQIPSPRAADAPDDVAIGRELLQRVLGAMAVLSSEDRSLVMAAADGVSSASLADRTGATAGSARVRLYRARRRLREAVAEGH